ncbi:hypothetical protein [Kribbella italica]|uniref:Uncharacterized protein n=1 Tax=Kribbella italica TaxID=1540520 RepID=A0A7W9J5G7_9ACTN|nr:hypothetical protein [Kribbella italica]MBB5835987.1 hypothetical protein [Kribbella italica]
MALRFIGKDPNSPNTNSPTVWVDEADGSMVIQGWKLDAESTAEVNAAAPIPDHETVVRIPARMAPFLKEAMGDG